jgi:hypothetical protein
MSPSKTFLGFLCVFFAVIAITAYFTRQPQGNFLASTIAQKGLLCKPDIPEVSESIQFLAQDTQFADKWALNSSPRRDWLNVYFFCRPRGGEFSDRNLVDLSDNCSYVGLPNVIICDLNFFESFLDHTGLVAELPAATSKKQEIKNASRNIFLWIIGHELGHIQNGNGPAHFEANKINDIVGSASLDQKRELEADYWFVRRLSRDKTRQLNVETTLLDLLYAQVRAKVGSRNLFPGTGVPITNQFIEYATAASHPEYVIRAIRMLSLSLDRPEVSKGFKQQIDGLATQLREAKPFISQK